MTLRSRLLSIFPAVALLFIVATAARCLATDRRGGGLCCSRVRLPLLVFRLTNALWPVVPVRAARLDRPVYSPWWGAHQIQIVYETFPFLEAALRMVPGLYSLWLRAWGARVGKRVYYPPTMRIMDRSLIEIGDGVVFGHHVECVSHFVAKRKDAILLFVQTIVIESGAMVGTHVAMGPGCHRRRRGDRCVQPVRPERARGRRRPRRRGGGSCQRAWRGSQRSRPKRSCRGRWSQW